MPDGGVFFLLFTCCCCFTILLIIVDALWSQRRDAGSQETKTEENIRENQPSETREIHFKFFLVFGSFSWSRKLLPFWCHLSCGECHSGGQASFECFSQKLTREALSAESKASVFVCRLWRRSRSSTSRTSWRGGSTAGWRSRWRRSTWSTASSTRTPANLYSTVSPLSTTWNSSDKRKPEPLRTWWEKLSLSFQRSGHLPFSVLNSFRGRNFPQIPSLHPQYGINVCFELFGVLSCLRQMCGHVRNLGSLLHTEQWDDEALRAERQAGIPYQAAGDGQVRDGHVVLIAIPRGVRAATETLHLRVLPQVHEDCHHTSQACCKFCSTTFSFTHWSTNNHLNWSRHEHVLLTDKSLHSKSAKCLLSLCCLKEKLPLWTRTLCSLIH